LDGGDDGPLPWIIPVPRSERHNYPDCNGAPIGGECRPHRSACAGGSGKWGSLPN